MTGTLFGGIIGFLGAIIPEIFQLIREKRGTTTSGTNGSVVAEDEPVVTRKPGEKSTMGGSGTQEDTGTSPAHQAEFPLTYTALDILRASVRPIVTYVFFGFFIYVRCVLLWHGLNVDNTKAIELLPILWDEGTETLFAAILSFWFGSRMMARFRRSV